MNCALVLMINYIIPIILLETMVFFYLEDRWMQLFLEKDENDAIDCILTK